MAKHKGSTTFDKITTSECLHSPTTRTIALLKQYGVQIRSLEETFPETNTPIDQIWYTKINKLTHPQQLASEKLLTTLYAIGI